MVITEGTEKIGIVAATTQLLEAISSPSGTEVKGFPGGPGSNGEVDDMDLLASQLQPIINELLAEGVNKIILQSHLQQIDNEQLLATKLSGVDIILAAGSNTRLSDADDQLVAFPGHDAVSEGPYPIVTQGLDGKTTLIVNTDGEFTYLGRLVVDFDANGDIIVSSLTANQAINGAHAATEDNVADAWGTTVANLATTAFADGTKGDKVEKLTDAVEAVINIKDGNVFGYTEVYLEGERGVIRNQETNLGDLVTDSKNWVARQVLGEGPFLAALNNAGGIRAQIGTVSDPDPITGEIDKLPPAANPDAGKPEGGVSQLDIENSLRFNNRLMVFDTTPQELLNILNFGAGLPANNGGFPQIGGVRFSYDPDLPGNSGLNPGSRIRDVALIDENGQVIAKLVDDGVVLADAPTAITVVTSNFTANGGDNYPIKANGSNFRFLLTDGTLSGPIDEALTFTDPAVVPVNALGEQQALADFIDAFHSTPATAYDEADTPQTGDTRIQNVNVRTDTVFNSAPINGTDGDDILVGGIGNDTINGLGGNDILIGAAGADDLNGGADNDTLNGAGGNDNLDGGAGTDTATFTGNRANYRIDALGGGITQVIDLRAGSPDGTNLLKNVEFVAFADGTNPVQTVLLNNPVILGTEGADNLVGTFAADDMNGLGGNDTIDGGAGSNNILAGSGQDFVTAAGNLNMAFGDDGNDQLYFVGDQNQLFGGVGDDWVGVGGTNNALVAGAGNDFLGATGMSNTLAAEAGNDTVFAVGNGNVLYGQDGHDWVGASGNGNTLNGGAGVDWVGATGNNNRLDGGAGNDTLVAAAGHANATFVFHAGYGEDQVVNFSTAGGDLVNLETFGLADFAALQPFMSQSGADVVIDLGADVLTLRNIQLNTLNAGHFDLV